MALYFFDIHDGTLYRDETGLECSDFDAVRREAKRALPEMARDILPADGDQRSLTVLVRNEMNLTVCTATLTFTELSLDVSTLE